MQWKVPKNVSSWVQRAGRAARAPKRQGLAVMLVEKSAFEVEAMPQPLADSTQGATPSQTRGRARGQGGVQGRVAHAKNGAQYAAAHGQRRGMFGGVHDEIIALDETHITQEMLRDAVGEGIYFHIQTTNCRRSVLGMIFRNKPSGMSYFGLLTFYSSSIKVSTRLVVVICATQDCLKRSAQVSRKPLHVRKPSSVWLLLIRSAWRYMDGGGI